MNIVDILLFKPFMVVVNIDNDARHTWIRILDNDCLMMRQC